MEECLFSRKCPIFNKFRHAGVRDFWIRSYCRRDEGERCERKKLRMAGRGPEEVPITLPPNGMHLVELEDSGRDWEALSENACSRLEVCSRMFNRFTDPESKRFWGSKFCFASSGSGCKRKSMMDLGADPEEVPTTMLPSGEHLPMLG
jgi:hypothetical protein